MAVIVDSNQLHRIEPERIHVELPRFPYDDRGSAAGTRLKTGRSSTTVPAALSAASACQVARPPHPLRSFFFLQEGTTTSYCRPSYRFRPIDVATRRPSPTAYTNAKDEQRSISNENVAKIDSTTRAPIPRDNAVAHAMT